MSNQMCLNCGERPAVNAPGSKTVPLCLVCAPKAGGSRGVTMIPKQGQSTQPRVKTVLGSKRKR
jgi:hypothetical protein